MKNQDNNFKKITKKDMIEAITILDKEFKDAKCGLDYTSPLSLTISLILAAQCTDARVNIICPILLQKYHTSKELANTELSNIEEIIRPCGFYKNKAKSIKDCCIKIENDYNGIVPDTMEELTKLPGIGRKSANIILQECFNKVEGIAVDTHVTRITRKMGISNGNSQDKIEKDLTTKIPKEYWSKVNHILVNHGRKYCIARRPQCDICPISNLCQKND